MTEHEEITDEDIKSELPIVDTKDSSTTSRKEKAILGFSKIRSGISSAKVKGQERLEERRISQSKEKEERFRGKLIKLGEREEEAEKELTLARKEFLVRKQKSDIKALEQKDKKPSFFESIVKKTLVGKPVKVTRKKKIKVKSKRKKIVKKRKSKVKISKSKTITIKLS